MAGLTAKSLSRLGTCHRDLQMLIKAVAGAIDIVVICGHRTQKEQNEAFANGKSKLMWPKSRHNSYPSKAVDIAPTPLDWEDIESFQILAAIVKEKAAELGIEVVWGGDWKIRDYVHWELVAPKEPSPKQAA